jgi:hypothetical protein
MDAGIPWSRLLDLIEPHYPNTGKGRPPHDLERMLRIYFLQQWFNLSDPQAEDAIYDSESMRRFARVELGEDRIPDESTILRFRHRLLRRTPRKLTSSSSRTRCTARRASFSATKRIGRRPTGRPSRRRVCATGSTGVLRGATDS